MALQPKFTFQPIIGKSLPLFEVSNSGIDSRALGRRPQLELGQFTRAIEVL